MRMEIESKILVGAESKAFLADLTKLVERMERAAGVKTKAGAVVEDDSDDLDDDTDFGVDPKPAKKAAAFEEDDIPGIDDADLADADTDADEDDDFAPKTKSKKTAAASFEEDDSDDVEPEVETKKTTKAKKAPKLTTDDLNDACKARVARLTKKGQSTTEALDAIRKVMKKRFGVKSVAQVKPEDFAKFIEVMSA